MEIITSKKNGLVYTDDFKTVVGIDLESTEFSGTVPNGATAVEEEAFSCCSLKKISLPDSVVRVGANLFCNCTELESVRLPAFLKTLSPFMFCGCKNLKEIEMPDEVEDFTEGLFAECSSLEEIPFRGGIKTLPEGVFDSCTSVKTLVIPDTVTKICTGALANLTSLETLVLPAGLEELESDWLSNCPNLRHIRISEENKKFRTDEDCHILYKVCGSGEIVEIELQNKSSDSLPGFKDPDTENSIISFDESEDITMDEPVFLNDAEVQAASQDVPETNSSMDDRLAEILGQNKMYDDGDFSIMDIPQASDEEIASNVLASTAEDDQKFANEVPVQVRVHESVENSPEDMEAKLKEIMGQNTDSFSINDIPMASEEELSANKVLEPCGDDSDDEGISASATNEEVLSLGAAMDGSEEYEDIPVPPQTEVNEDKAFMQSLCFESSKVEQQNLGSSGDNRILFVFAENCVETPLGKKFSTKLKSCCSRLASIHNFTSIYYFNDVRLDTEKFREQLKSFLVDKDVLIACEGDDLYSISEHTREFAEIVSVPIDPESIRAEIELSKNSSVKPLKLIVSDNLEE